MIRNVRFATSLSHRTSHLSERSATLMVLGSGVASAFVAFFARSLTDAGLAPVAVAFFRFGATVILTARFVSFSPDKRSASTWATGAGLCLGLGWVAYVAAIERLDVATVGAVYMTYPVFALGASRVLFRLRLSTRSLAGALLVMIGAGIAIGPSSATTGSATLLVAFAAPISFGVVVAVLSERVHVLEPLERISATSIGALAGLLPIVAMQPIDSVLPDDTKTWALVLSIGLFTSLLPMGLFVLGAPVVGSGRAATAGGIELPTVFAIAWILLDEPPTAAQILGGALIVAAVAISPTRPPAIATARPRPRPHRRPDSTRSPRPTGDVDSTPRGPRG